MKNIGKPNQVNFPIVENKDNSEMDYNSEYFVDEDPDFENMLSSRIKSIKAKSFNGDDSNCFI